MCFCHPDTKKQHPSFIDSDYTYIGHTWFDKKKHVYIGEKLYRCRCGEYLVSFFHSGREFSLTSISMRWRVNNIKEQIEG